MSLLQQQRSAEAVELQRKITRLSIRSGQLLQQHGAESTLIAGITQRLGKALGADEVEVSLSAGSMVVTTLMNEQCMTTVRRCADSGINMQIVTTVQRICILVEHKIYDIKDVEHKLNTLDPMRYNPWLVASMVALSCAAFSRLAGGDVPIFSLTFVASFVGMVVRQWIARHHFNPLLNFAVTAFVTTCVAGIGIKMHLVEHPFIVMGSSVLMLVPGFPLINSVADMVKGYINMGIARWTMATLLTLATTLGIISAMSLLNVWEWH